MGQLEVLEWLKKKRLKGNEFFRSTEIIEGLLLSGVSKCVANKTYDNLLRLTQYGLIDCKGVGLWNNHHKLFRYKTK